MGLVTLKISAIRRDPQAQSRESINWVKALEYSEAMKGQDGAPGDVFPPGKALKDEDGNIWLWDGNHTLEARLKAGFEDMDVLVEPGTLRDAILLAAGANHDHGQPRSDKDKRKAILTLLRDSEWGQWSDREIARRTRTDRRLVSQLRASVASPDLAGKRTYTDKHGNTSEMNVGKIGKGKAKGPKPDDTAIGLLKGTAAAEDPDQVEQLAMFDPEEQVEIAGKVYQGLAETVDEAAQLVASEKRDAAVEHTEASAYVFSSKEQVLQAAAQLEKEGYTKAATSSKTDEHPTDRRYWQVHLARFGAPALDVCATAENALAERYFSREQNGLQQDWALPPGQYGFMNPPFGSSGGEDNGIELWIEKAFQTAMSGQADMICLLPANTHTVYWYNWARFGQVIFLISKLQYGDFKSGRVSGGDALVIFPRGMAQPGYQPSTEYWDWKGRNTDTLPYAAGAALKGAAVLEDRAFIQMPKPGEPEHLIWTPFRYSQKHTNKQKKAG